MQVHLSHGAAALRRYWRWVLLGGIALGIAGFLGGYQTGFYTATIELIDHGSDGSPSDPEKGGGAGAAAPEFVAGIARSDFVAQRVAGTAEVSAGADALAAAVDVSVTPGVGLVAVKVKGRNAGETIRLANRYGEQIAMAAQTFLDEQHAAAHQQIARKLAAVDGDLRQASLEVTEFQRRTTGMEFEGEWAAPIRRLRELDRQAAELRGKLEIGDLQIQSLSREISRLTPALVAAKDALTQALMRYTEQHPKVKELRATVVELEAQGAAEGVPEDPGVGVLNSPSGVSLYTRLVEMKGQRAADVFSLESLVLQRHQCEAQVKDLPETQSEQVRLKSKFEALKEQRFALARRVQEAQPVPGANADRVKVIANATAGSLSRGHKWTNGIWCGAGSALAGLLVATLFAMVFPGVAGRIGSGHELARATRLPLLATLGELQDMSEAEAQQWAFRTFTALRGALAGSGDDALVCAFTSASHGEGRSTWIRLLAGAAGRLGYKVVTVSADAPGEEDKRIGSPALETGGAALAKGVSGQVALVEPAPSQSASLSATWAWNPDYREQWGHAIQEWRGLKRLVVLVELPPASRPETVLLAEKIPNLVWLCDQDKVRTVATRLQLHTLRNARVNMVGCVLNRPARRRKPRFHHRAAACGLLLGLMAIVARAQDAVPAVAPLPTPPAPAPAPANATNTVVTLSVSAPDRLAEWQKRLTLGPGDAFEVTIFEQPDSGRGLSIGPDGRINYLEARDVTAAGLTVDELRAKLEESLATFHRAPRVVINPTAYTSKKYYILGHVNQKGVFPLDRPVSIIEAIARARGFVSSFQQRNEWVQADLSRSFLVRRGADGAFAHVPVDFEGLFLRGDLAQNFSMAPDDYVFFPPMDLQEVYVLGEVRTPGVVAYTPETTALGAIIARGSFSERAYKSRVLIVRGSLNYPQTIVLNVSDVFKGKGLDFPLKNRDIIYVHRKPWAKAAELLEQSVIAFVNAFIVAYSGNYIGPFIKEPLVPLP